jgi:hypothetical protein
MSKVVRRPLAEVEPMPKAAGKWNTYEVTAKGPAFTVVLNGQITVDGTQDAKFKSGPVALQYGAGMVKDKGVNRCRGYPAPTSPGGKGRVAAAAATG